MNVMNSSCGDDQVECPLCMEPLEVDDLNFFPCTCGYQICRFCWHRIRTDENELCPACRKAYPENPADFTPLSQEQIAAFKAEKRQRDQQRKAKISENRKHLANVRVVQKNLVFVVGLPPRLAEAEILKKHEYFGKYGKIHKVVINPSTTYAGVQGPSASAYVTYVNNNDALRAIQSVNNIMIDGRLIKTSLGTTKYCSHFMKNQTCPKPDCMYLHELGDSEASFTKEMHQGKHQEYEKRLHEIQQAQALQQAQTNGVCNGTTNGIIVNGTGTGTGNGGGKTGDNNQMNDITNGPNHNKEAWPSLSTSPVNNKENKINGKSGTNNKENINKSERKHDRTKSDKTKGKINGQQKQTNSNHNSTNTDSQNSNKHLKQINHHITDIEDDDEDDDDLDDFEDIENDALSSDNDAKTDSPSLSSTASSSNNGDSGTVSESASGKSSPGAFPDPPTINISNNQDSHVIAASIASTPSSTASIPLNDTTSSISNSKTDSRSSVEKQTNGIMNSSSSSSESSSSLFSNNHNIISDATSKLNSNLNGVKLNNLMDPTSRFSKLSLFDDNSSFFSHNTFQPFYKLDSETGPTTNSHLPDLLNGTNDTNEHNGLPAKELLKNLGSLQQQQQQQHPHINNSNHIQQLTGLGLGDTNSLNTTDDWEAAFKYMMRGNNPKQIDEHHEELIRIQELQKRNNLLNGGLNLPQYNGFNGDYNTDYFHNSNDINSRLSQSALVNQQQSQQQQQQRMNNMHTDLNHIYSGNMSKFFDFHKNQQQQQQSQQQQQFLLNGHSNNAVPPPPSSHSTAELNIANLLDNNNRFNPHYLDQHSNGLLGSQIQKQRLLNNQINTHSLLMNNSQQQPPQPNNRLPIPHIPQQYTQNPVIDDDLGFDPFIETQKALAELINDEIIQQQQTQTNHKLLENCQRTRMPPPGFNHMNAFGFGVPRAQSSKILPFMNLGNNGHPQQPPQTNWGQPLQQQQQQQQQQQHMGFPQNDQNHVSQSSQPPNGLNKADWTSFDPAIVSFRQFSSFMNGPAQQNQQNANDMFMSQQQQQQMNQQQTQNMQQQPGQGFGHHGINMQSSIMNQQQSNQQAQVNFSHTNWLNTDQNIYMSNLSNGFTNNFDKFTIPMPPGFQNNVTGNNKQKAECN